jgi:riboflavin kinase/FMN adenylyltransferase
MKARVISSSDRLIALTFDPHPAQILRPEIGVTSLFAVGDRIQELKHRGIDEVRVIPFTKNLAELEPEPFFKTYILTETQCKNLVVGHDFSFGKNRSGTFTVLKGLCEKYQINLEKVAAVTVDGSIVSSTAIRRLLEAGDVKMALRYLSRPYALYGTVIQGQKRGVKLGFPTANLSLSGGGVLGRGVYVTKFNVHSQSFLSVTNVGFNPTFNKSEQTASLAQFKIETHVLDFKEDIYGMTVKVEFVDRLRDEIKFSSVESLVNQIKKDITETRERYG